MTTAFDAFESLGANCEFGFVLGRLGNQESSLFRWAEIPEPASLLACLDRDLEGLLDFAALEPFNPGMVLDRASGIAWHSALHSEAVDPGRSARIGNLRFLAPEGERRQLHAAEREKIAHLASKTRTAMRENARIFVFKPIARNKDFGLATAEAILTALRARGADRLLVVTRAITPHEAGRVTRLPSGLLHGRIDRFAPGAQADDVSLVMWRAICEAALALDSGARDGGGG